MLNTDYDIEKAFKAIEDELIASMMRNLASHRAEETDMGFNWSQWQVEQLKALEKYKAQNKKKFTKSFSNINDSIDAMIFAARQEGGTEQEQKILRALKKGLKASKVSQGAEGAFFKLNTRKLEALIKATKNDFGTAEKAMLRMSEDKYRQIIFNAQVYANTGAGTYEKAVDMATKDFLKAGINCIEYANGARHTAKDYAKMAIQTASKRAYLTGEGEMRQSWGISTVIMNKRANACPKCLPFVGKVLIDDEVLLPAMLDAVAYNTVAKTMDREGGGTARFSFRIDGRGDISGPINVQRENMYYAAAGIGKLINQELVEAGTILTQNKFEKVDIYGVNINIVLDDKAEVAEIISAAVREKEASPGDTVHIDVQLQPYRAPKVTKTVLFKIPKEQREGKLPLTVRGGSSLAWIQNLLRKQREEGVPAQQKDNRKTLNDFIKSINEADQNNDLIVDIAAGQGAPNAAMQSGGGFASMLEGSPMKQKTTMNFIVDGTTDIVIDVVK